MQMGTQEQVGHGCPLLWDWNKVIECFMLSFLWKLLLHGKASKIWVVAVIHIMQCASVETCYWTWPSKGYVSCMDHKALSSAYEFIFRISVIWNLDLTVSLLQMNAHEAHGPAAMSWPQMFSFKLLYLSFDLHLQHSKWQNQICLKIDIKKIK